MKTRKNQCRRSRKFTKGFALVVSLTMMVLLTIVAVGLLSLSSITLRTATQTSAQAEAQANARLALMIAIGELQKQMGPDQRISANADILSLNEAGVETPIPNPHWLGVWDSWIAGDLARAPVTENYPSAPNSAHQTLGSTPEVRLRPNYAQKNRHFRAWLLSIDPDAATNIFRAAGPALRGEEMPGPADNAVRLVGAGSVGPTELNDFVGAQLMPIRENATSPVRGRYAWWVGDESQKATLLEDTYDSEGSLSLAKRLFRQQAPASQGNTTVVGLASVSDSSLFSKLPSRNSISLLHSDADLATRQFHDVTTASFGVLADVREGGLKRDLQTILERRIDHEEVYNYINVPVGDNPSFQRATSFRDGGERFILYHFDDIHQSSVGSVGQASVPIQDLAAYYQLYDNYRTGWRGGIQYSSSHSTPANSLLSNGIMISNPDFGTTNTDDEKYIRQYTTQYRSVIPVKTEVVLSYVTEERDFDAEIAAWLANANPPGTEEEDLKTVADAMEALRIPDDPYILRIGITPSMTFWNPNNVPMVMNIGNPELYSIFFRHHPIPARIRIRKSSSPDGSPDGTHSVLLRQVGRTQQAELFTMFLSGNFPAVFQPGESKVFSLQFTSLTDADDGDTDIDFYLRGTGYRYSEPFVPSLELIPGWNPERFVRPTNRSSTRTGDAFTFNAGDFISAEIDASTNGEFDFHFTQKSRQIRNQARTRWHHRTYGMRNRFDADATFKNNMTHLGFPRAGRGGGIASTAPRTISVPPRRATRLIAAMGDPDDLTDDLPESFFYYGVKAGVETHELRNVSPPSGGSGRRFASRPFLHSTPLASLFVDNVDGASLYNQGWNWFFMPLDNLFDAPISISSENFGYFGGGYTAESGTTHVVQQQLPLTPPISIAALSHARLGGFSLATEPANSNGENQYRVTAVGHAGLAPAMMQAVGNSYAHPNIRPNRAFETISRMFQQGSNVNRPLADHSYLVNKALWDQFFMSSIFPSSTNVRIINENRMEDEVAEGFFFRNEHLPNRRLVPNPGSMTTERLGELLAEYDVFTDGFADKIAAYMMVKGAFNINSTSETAWRALFSSLRGKPISYFEKETSLTGGINLRETPTSGVPVSSGPIGNRGTYTGSPANPNDPDQWLGTRELTDAEIDELARAMVRQVKMRGPFLSLSEFVNRRLDSTNRQLAVKGALQAALDDPDVSINAGFRNTRRTFSEAEINFVSPVFREAMEGPIAYGSPAYVDQADILRNFPAQLTPRGDTFVIRTYGDALDAAGNVIARAWCEATVQRLPEYENPDDEPHVTQANLTSDTNRRFGRQFVITSFRWLNPSEV